MPGTSSTGVHRLRKWAIALVVGAAACSVPAGPAEAAAPRPATTAVAALRSAGGGSAGQVVRPSSPAPSRIAAVPGARIGIAVAPQVVVAPAATAGVADGVAGGVSGQAAEASDLAMEGVTSPPRAVPWIVGVLLALVVAGAVRAYGRSPQRAALRSRRAQH